MRLKYFIYILMFLTLSCVKEQEAIVPEGTVTATIPYKAVVQGSELTRASITGDFGTGSYIFQTGDKLYISYEEDETVKLYGFLNLMSGEGTGAGTFGGTLNCVGGYLPTNNPEVSATLVGLGQDQAEEPATPFFTFSENRIIANYPSEIPFEAGGLAEYVKKYSHFTATNNFDAKSFTLEQQAVFLNFNINLLTSSMTGSPSTVDVDIKSAEGSSTLHRVTSVPVGGSAFMASMVFSTVVPKGSSLRGAQIVVDNGDGIHCEPDFADDEYFVLLANKYYTVARTNVDPFTVEAPTGATITYKFGTNTEYKKYSGGEWGEWTSYSEPIDLSAGDKVSFRGKNNSYANTGGSTPLFTTNNPVNIYGDIMSLMCDENWVRKSTVGNQAFYQAFKGVAVNIPNDKELILSATTLGTSCYDSMFFGCTSLTKTPILPATTMALACYRKMFEECTNLSNVPSTLLPAMTLANGCYERMFWKCENLVTAPDLPATAAMPGCYFCMFRHCSRLNSVKCYLPKAGFSSTSSSTPSGYPETADPTVAQISTWTVSTLWTVVNKWLNNTCTINGGNKGSFKCPSDMTGIYKTGDNDVGAVPSKYWTISALP